MMLSKPRIINTVSSVNSQTQLTRSPIAGAVGRDISLSDLKTGLKLNGIVASSTPYAAFIDTGVKRSGKGGALLPVNAMLHKSDISPVALAALQKATSGSTRARFEGPRPLLEKNTPVVVYVKEVFKQSGRFTVTTDSEIKKVNILEDHERIRLEGLERRRTRRLRRQLEEVAAGTTVTGYVDRVINDGVLVSITSLGSLNVTGLIHKRDLPVQFQVPSNLKDIFQIQLLQQDFMPGREVICGVSQVHPNPSSALTYNLKLQFEEFGAAPDDELHFEDKFDSMTEKEKDAIITNRKFALHEDDDDEEDNEEQNGVDDNDDSEESDFEEEFGDMETEVKEIYEELLAASIAADAEAPPQAQLPSKRKPKPVARRTELRVQDLYDWEALQEMLEEGDIVPDDVEDALRLVGLKTDDASATLSLQQFQAVIGILQNSIEGDGQEGDVEEDEGNEGQVADLSRGSAARIGAPNFNQASASKAQAAMSHLDDHDPGYEVEEDEVGEGEEGELSAGEEFEEMLQEVFDELKGRDGKVTVKAFKAWADIQEMLNQGVLDMATLDSMIQEATGAPVVAKASGKKGSKAVGKAAKEPSLDFEQFAQLVQDLDEVAGGPYEDDDEDGAFEDSDGDGGDDNQPVVPREIFDTLTKGQPKLKVKDFAAWEDVRELMQDEQLGTEDLKEFVGRVGSTMNGELDYEQFCELFDLVLNPNGHEDDSSDINEEATDNEEEEDDSDDSAAVRADDSSGNVQSEEDRALTLELFDELRGKAEKVSVKDFIAWDEVQQLLQDEYLDMESLEALLQTVGSSPQGQLDFEQFSDLLGIIEDTVETMENEDMEGEDRDGTNIDSSDSGLPSAQQVASTIDQRESNRRGSSRYASKSSAIESYNRQFNDNDDDEDYDEEGVTDRDTGREEGEPSDEELDDMARLVFDELRPSGRDTVPVKAFVAWNGIQNEIAAGVLNRAEVQQVVRSVDPAGAGELTFDQFLSAMNQLEVIIEERTNPEWENEQGSIGQAEEIALPKLSAPVPKTASNKASSAMKQDAAVGFGKVVAPVQQGKNDKKSADEEEQYEATQREIEALSAEIFAEIKGKAKVLTVQKLKEWDELQEMIENGDLKRSTLEQALVKIGAAATGTVTLQQFSALLDILQNKIDDSSLDMSLLQDKIASLQASTSSPSAHKSPAIPSSTRARIASAEELAYERMQPQQRFNTLLPHWTKGVDDVNAAEEDDAEGDEVEDGLVDLDQDYYEDGYDENGEEEEEEGRVGRELTEEEAAKEVYEELRGGKRTATLGDFLEWGDLQDLLEVGALTKDQLGQAIEQSRVNVKLGDQSSLSFEMFYELIQIIDHFVDHSKLDHAQDDLVFEQNISVEGLQDAAGVMDIVDRFNSIPKAKSHSKSSTGSAATASAQDTRISYQQPSGAVHHGDAAISAMQADSAQREKDNEYSDLEIEEMFADLSKGKGYITEKALRKWDELQGLIEAEIATQEVLDSMFSRLRVENGRVSMEAFRQFIGMLDTVLVDDSGNILGFDEQHRAVDLDGLEEQ